MNTDYNITLWGVSVSPYVQKVKVALAEKQLSYEQIELLPASLLNATGQEIPEAFNEVSPLGKIPALKVDDFCIADSSVIVQFLERRFPNTMRLLPDNAKEHATTLWFEMYANTVMSDSIYKKVFLEAVVKPAILNIEPNNDQISAAVDKEIPLIFDYLDKHCAENTWCTGEQFSIADIAITTQLCALKTAGFDLLASNKWPALKDHFSKTTARPSFNK